MPVQQSLEAVEAGLPLVAYLRGKGWLDLDIDPQCQFSARSPQPSGGTQKRALDNPAIIRLDAEAPSMLEHHDRARCRLSGIGTGTGPEYVEAG